MLVDGRAGCHRLRHRPGPGFDPADYDRHVHGNAGLPCSRRSSRAVRAVLPRTCTPGLRRWRMRRPGGRRSVPASSRRSSTGSFTASLNWTEMPAPLLPIVLAAPGQGSEPPAVGRRLAEFAAGLDPEAPGAGARRSGYRRGLGGQGDPAIAERPGDANRAGRWHRSYQRRVRLQLRHRVAGRHRRLAWAPGRWRSGRADDFADLLTPGALQTLRRPVPAS